MSKRSGEFLSQRCFNYEFPCERTEWYEGDVWSDVKPWGDDIYTYHLTPIMLKCNKETMQTGQGFLFAYCGSFGYDGFARINREMYFMREVKNKAELNYRESYDGINMFFFKDEQATPFNGGWFFCRETGKWVRFQPLINYVPLSVWENGGE